MTLIAGLYIARRHSTSNVLPLSFHVLLCTFLLGLYNGTLLPPALFRAKSRVHGRWLELVGRTGLRLRRPETEEVAVRAISVYVLASLKWIAHPSSWCYLLHRKIRNSRRLAVFVAEALQTTGDLLRVATTPDSAALTVSTIRVPGTIPRGRGCDGDHALATHAASQLCCRGGIRPAPGR